VKRDEDADEGASNRSSKKKNKQRHGGSLMAAVEQKGKKTPTKGTSNHFEKMLEGPCPNHAFPIKHLYKDCSLMKQFLSGGSKKVDQKKKSDSVMEDDVKEKDDGFPKMMGCLMIFGGMTAYDSKRCQKLTRREVYAAETTMSAFLRWSESMITFDRSDHLESIL
jgi:hypothetical protein